MDKIIAFCGLDCAACDARKAHMTGDAALRAATAAKWTKDYGFPFTPEMIDCSGCSAPGPKIGHCAECAMRACGLGRGVENCGTCPDFSGCAKIAEFMAQVPPAKANLEAIRAGAKQ